MDKLSYLLTFMAIIIGVGVSDIVVSLNRLISNSKMVKWHIVPILWTLNVFLALIYYFYVSSVFIGFNMANHGIGFVALIIPQLVLLFLALAILPNKVEEKGVNLLTYYYSKKRYIGLLFLLHFWAVWILRVIEYLYADKDYDLKLGMLILPIILFSIIIFTKKMWLHIIVAVLILSYFLFFLSKVSLNI